MRWLAWILVCCLATACSSFHPLLTKTQAEAGWQLAESTPVRDTYFVRRDSIITLAIYFDLKRCQDWIKQIEGEARSGKLAEADLTRLVDLRIKDLPIQDIARVGLSGQYQGATALSPTDRLFNWEEVRQLNPNGVGAWKKEIDFPSFSRKYVFKNNGAVEIVYPAPIVFKIIIESVDGQLFWTAHPDFPYDRDGGNWNSIYTFADSL